MMISRLSSNTEIPVPSNSTREGSFWDLNLKNTEDVMMKGCIEDRNRCGVKVDARLSTEVKLSQALNTRECSKISSRKGREGVYLFANATVAKSRSSFFRSENELKSNLIVPITEVLS